MGQEEAEGDLSRDQVGSRGYNEKATFHHRATPVIPNRPQLPWPHCCLGTFIEHSVEWSPQAGPGSRPTLGLTNRTPQASKRPWVRPEIEESRQRTFLTEVEEHFGHVSKCVVKQHQDYHEGSSQRRLTGPPLRTRSIGDRKGTNCSQLARIKIICFSLPDG